MLALLTVAVAHGQISSNTFQAAILPAPNTVMVTQTVNAVFVSVANLSLWTNVAVNLKLGLRTLPLLDNGLPPDLVAGDGTFSGNLTVPAFPTSRRFTVTISVSGQDLSVTNDVGDLLPGASVTNTTSIDYIAVVRPANDNFTNAVRIADGGDVLTSTNNYASIEPEEPFHGDDPAVSASVWWVWSSPTNTEVLIDTAGSSFAPVLGVYSGLTLATLAPVAASTNDVADGLKANVHFNARAGVTYRIAVAGYDSTGVGQVRLTVRPGGLPDTSAPEVIVGSPSPGAVLTNQVVTVIGTAKDAGPDDTGVATVQVQLNSGPPIAAVGTTNWTANLTLALGTNTITVLAKDVAGNVSQPVLVTVLYLNPVNDDFANALILAGQSGVISGNSANATKEPGEPFHAENDGGRSVWYSFTAPDPGTLYLSTSNSTFSTLLAVYGGDSLTNLVAIASNQEASPGSGYSALTATVEGRQLYYIAVDGWGGAGGAYQLSYQFTSSLRYFQLTVAPTSGGIIVPPAGLYAEGSTQYVVAVPSLNFGFFGWTGATGSLGYPITLVMTQNYSLGATFAANRFSEDFESGRFGPGFSWASGGTAPWLVESNVVYDGQFSVRSGAISDSQTSSVFADADTTIGSGSFALKVSSEAGWDALEFYLNGSLQQRWSGEVPWQTYSFAVPAGHVHLEWRYVKDANFSAGLDAAFLDDIYVPLTGASQAAHLAMTLLPNGLEQLAVEGAPGRAYAVQTSADLTNWVSVFTNSSAAGPFVYYDTPGTNSLARFFRALLK